MVKAEFYNYSIPKFNKKKRVFSYWYQVNEIFIHSPKNILEIGIGNGFVSDYLRKKGFKVTTLDIDKNLNPDIIGNVLNIPFSNKSFDMVACFEVLEHLPYDNFTKALNEIYRVCYKYTIISLPDINRVCRFNIEIPKLGEIKKLIPIPRFKKVTLKPGGVHFWEIGVKNYPLQRIRSDIENVGFIIQNTYRIYEYPFHRFFILKKKS
jgi:ubiquinone/menaquinone biosynthesis C-methylase UbiE